MEFFVTANGIPIHISVSGEGEKRTLLFLHGYLETLYIWDDFRSLLPAGYKSVAIDLPGHGLSGTHAQCNDMKFYSDVLASIAQKLKLSDIHIIGHSMGGYIGQRAIREYPDLFVSLTHFNSNPYADNPDKKKQRLKEIELVENGRLVQLAQIAIPNMYAKQNLRKFDEKIHETVEMCETHDPFGISSTIRGLMTREDNVEFLKSTSTPVMFIFGDSDNYLPLERANEIVASLPEAKYHFIHETGHNSFIEKPTEVMNALTCFVESIPQSSNSNNQ